MFRKPVFAAVLLSSVAFSSHATAAEFVYRYQGKTFQVVNNTTYFNRSYSISGSFEVATRLGRNLQLKDISDQISYLEFSNGLSDFFIDSIDEFLISTKDNGEISQWSIRLSTRSNSNGARNNIKSAFTDNESIDLGGYYRPPSGFNKSRSGSGTVNIPGDWSYDFPAAVPEPGTWMMLVLGFGLIGAAMRASKRKPRVNVSYA